MVKETSRDVDFVCPICKCSDQEMRFASVEDLEYKSYKGVNYVVCSGCELISQYPSPSREILPSFYPVNYRNFMPVERNLLVFLKTLQAKNFARRILAHIAGGSENKILDIGFGNGQLLLALSSLGCKRLYGSDFTARDCSYLEKEGIRLDFSDIEEVFPFPEKFDCIIMNNVIEHFLDPIKVLERCKEHLSENGKVILVTPNAGALELSFFKKFWAGFHAPRHTFLFSRRNIKLLAKSLGFRDVRVESFSDPGQWSISCQNVFQSCRLSRTNLKNGLAWYSVPLSIAVLPLVLLQNLIGKSTAMLCVLEN